MAFGHLFAGFGSGFGYGKAAKDKVHFGPITAFFQIFDQLYMRPVDAAVLKINVRPGFNGATEQFITDVIRGVKTVDDFDDYVASWKANGGDKITEEVNAWYTAQ